MERENQYNLASFRMYMASCTGNRQNTLYSYPVQISSADDLALACLKDHVCTEFKDNKRSSDNFIRCHAVQADCDNDNTDDPAAWITPANVSERLPGTAFYAVKSRNCDKVKHPGEPGERSARPRWHYYFPLRVAIPRIDVIREIMTRLLVLFPEFDRDGMKPAQFFFGHDEPVAEYHPGEKDVAEFLMEHPEIIAEETPADDTPAEKSERIQAASGSETDFLSMNLPDMLAVIPSDDYGDWISVGMALKAAGADISMWDDWSKTSAKYPGFNAIVKKWNSFSGGSVTAGTIVHLAQENGWTCPPEKRTGEYARKDNGPDAGTTSDSHTGAPGKIETVDPETGEILPAEPAQDAERQTTETISGITVHNNAKKDAAKPAKKPEWLIVRQWQGRDVKRINEPKFAEIFQEEHKVVRINGVFYVNGESVQDDYILMLIQKTIAVYFKENTAWLTRNIFNALANSAYADQPEPDESKIYCNNGITINVNKNGTFDPVKEELFTLTRIAADYDPSATCPMFIKYLEDLFYAEDIPAVQEYFGYCLIPCTRAQAGMFIKGKGGEGKSVIRDVTMALFGRSAIQEYVHELGERFTIANLENKLVVIDDDLQTDLLKETSTLKKLITARERFQVERKLKTKYDAYLYARILAIGNTFIGSKFDHSDGFYRRQLLIDVKPKTRAEKDDDRFMSDKCIKETSGVLNWALEGLSRLIKNNYHFTVSERMARTLDNIKHDGDNSLTFIEDDMYIEITKDSCDRTTSADLFTLYAAWCSDNGDVPIHKKSFQLRMSERFKDCKTRIRSSDRNLQGFTGIRLTEHAERRLSRMTEKERERIIRLP